MWMWKNTLLCHMALHHMTKTPACCSLHWDFLFLPENVLEYVLNFFFKLCATMCFSIFLLSSVWHQSESSFSLLFIFFFFLFLQIIWLYDHSGRLFLSGFSFEFKPLTPESTGSDLQPPRRVRSEAALC